MGSSSETLRSGRAAQRPAIVLFLVLLACYAYFPPRWAEWNQNSRFDLVMAIVDDQSVQIDRYVANTGDYAYVDGHYYSDKAPGTALLGVPVYAAFRALAPSALLARLSNAAGDGSALGATLRPDGTGLAGDKLYFFVALTVTTFVTVALPSAALGVLVFLVAGQLGLSRRPALVAAALFGLATSAFPYANLFVGHQLSAALLFAAFALLLARRRGSLDRRCLPVVGFLIAYAAITEYPTALIGGLLGLYALATVDRRPAALAGDLAWLAAGALPALGALAVHDYAAFGTLLPVGYLHSALWTDVHQQGFVSLTGPRLDALWGVTFGLHRGLFFLSPFLLLALPGYAALWRAPERRPELAVLALAPASFLLFNGSSAMWSGGFGVGPRYMVPCLPFLAVAAGFGLARVWTRPALRPIVVLAAAWSLVAVWAETIAGQSFPDYTPNPLLDLSLPRLASGDMARNLGMFVGLTGWASLLPLLALVLLAVAIAAIDLPTRRTGRPEVTPQWASR
jgi:hypothetical protein